MKKKKSPPPLPPDEDFGLPKLALPPLPPRSKRWPLFLLGLVLGTGIGYGYVVVYPTAKAYFLACPIHTTHSTTGTSPVQKSPTPSSSPVQATTASTSNVQYIDGPTGHYYIVLNSFKQLSSAQHYAFNLDLSPVYILAPLSSKEVHRVAIGRYATRAQAYQYLEHLRQQHGAELWPYFY